MTWKPLPARSKEDSPSDLGVSLDRLSESFGAPPSAVLRIVFARWEEVVGEALAIHAKPVLIRHGTLLIAVDEPCWATEVKWLAAELLDKLATTAGEPVASRVEVRVHRSGRGDPPGEQRSGKMGLSSGSATQATNAVSSGRPGQSARKPDLKG